MQKKYVRIANAILDLDPFELENRGYPEDETNPNILRLDGNQATVGTSPRIISVIKGFLDRRPLSWYPDPEAKGLKAKIAGYTRLREEYIGCYPGSKAALEYIARTYLEPGSEMLVSGPVFSGCLNPGKSTGALVIEVGHNDPLSPGIEPIIDHIGRRTRILYIGNPSETIGSFFTEAELVFLLAYAEHAMVVFNESYLEFSGFSAADFVKKFPNLAVIRSFSNAFGLAALKAGYVISDPENISYINRLRGENGIDAVSQIAAEAVLDDPEYMLESVRTINDSKKKISSSLPEIGFDFYMAPTNFLLLRTSNSGSARDYLKDNGIMVKDLSGLRQMEGYLRISIGTAEQTDRLLLHLSRMAKQFATGFNRNRIARSEERSDKRVSEPVGVK